MIPHKTPRGAAALERLKAFEGVPFPYDKVGGPQPAPHSPTQQPLHMHAYGAAQRQCCQPACVL